MLLQELSEHQLQLVEILHTHAHLDHFLASGKIKEATGAKLSLHQEDSFPPLLAAPSARAAPSPRGSRPRIHTKAVQGQVGKKGNFTCLLRKYTHGSLQ